MSERRVPASLRRTVAQRAHGCCEYCLSQASYATQSFSVEHVEPQATGGRDALGNLALACQGCNNHKYDRIEARDPLTDGLVPLYHPRRDPWADHFAWSADYSIVIGVTSTGRATVEALHLNRPSLVNLRRIPHGSGQHPPRDLPRPE